MSYRKHRSRPRLRPYRARWVLNSLLGSRSAGWLYGPGRELQSCPIKSIDTRGFEIPSDLGLSELRFVGSVSRLRSLAVVVPAALYGSIPRGEREPGSVANGCPPRGGSAPSRRVTRAQTGVSGRRWGVPPAPDYRSGHRSGHREPIVSTCRTVGRGTTDRSILADHERSGI